MQVLTPRSLAEALESVAADPALVPIAGGTDLLVSWHHRVKDDWKLLDLSGLRPELSTMTLTDDQLELGALTTYWDVIADADVSGAFPLLTQAAGQVGAIQIQTRGTWAGNIGNGSPAADGVPVLMAYDATVVLQSRNRLREVPLDSYFTGYKQTVKQPDELITHMRVPRRSREHEWFHKVGARRAQAIAKVGVAIVRDAQGVRVVSNSVAPFVCRCTALEQALADGVRFESPEQIQAVLASDISPIDDVRSTAAYRAKVLSRLVFHWLKERGLA